MSLKFKEDSIAGIRLREAQKTKTATSASLVGGSIVLDLMQEGGVCTGTMVKFKAPCDSSAVTGGISIDGVTYTVVDALGKCISGKPGYWVASAKLAVIIEANEGKAYVTNPAGVAKGGDEMIGTLRAGEQTPGEYLVRNTRLLPMPETDEELAEIDKTLSEGEICWFYRVR